MSTSLNSLGSNSGGYLDRNQLSVFRTEICKAKAATSFCVLKENCCDSHCLSWHRRNPFLYPYRPLLCPNTRFWTEAKRMKVRTWCKRGRLCLFAHTKEEQMYHPLVYKTQVCRDYPRCDKPYCPFAHGLHELRDPEQIDIPLLQGPEIVEDHVAQIIGEDRILNEFLKAAKDREQLLSAAKNIPATAPSTAENAGVVLLDNDKIAVGVGGHCLSPFGILAIELETLSIN
ncbi:hypothetical protein GNI_054300 [Gregarina niphandrodes]|uniref:Zinc finger protein n=1 Tax=Gregarina niphandrodes TaxID=110365 RepID=A0A023B908_GRENI|nr:hypothetical protein GNI_054300 [Gregarina niphandrodes]EZG70714.1 hypothetical protein GNI_054300 [Gregarina niphandrodes]|eukprot:XP_011129869.1 hypothetical protein GNI_054300 [Gregarina niphandrodes]